MWDILINASTFDAYPVQTIIHWLQGIAAGVLYVHGHHRKTKMESIPYCIRRDTP